MRPLLMDGILEYQYSSQDDTALQTATQTGRIKLSCYSLASTFVAAVDTVSPRARATPSCEATAMRVPLRVYICGDLTAN